VQVHCHGRETNPQIPLFRQISLHIFPQMPKDVGLQFVLMEKIHNSQLLEHWGGSMSMLFTFE
jgi:hypothetical protein